MEQANYTVRVTSEYRIQAESERQARVLAAKMVDENSSLIWFDTKVMDWSTMFE